MNFHVCLKEWRHAHGMRCLGIPNTAHFANVTQIEDAVSCELIGADSECSSCSDVNGIYVFYVTVVWAKLKSQKASERWQPDTEVPTLSRHLCFVVV